MSPDIHWHVGDDTEQETIAHASSLRRSRRSWIALAIVVVLGAGLGLTYRSLPEPTPRPTPVLSPTSEPMSTRPAIPAALYQTIDREAQALADGDFETYRETWTQAALDLIEEPQQHFTAWGRPGDDRPLYTLVDFNLLTATSAWVDIRQIRDGRYFRETRFYYQKDDRWWHGPTNHVLWNGQEERKKTPHFDVTYAIEDRDVISPTLHQLEEDYQSLCRDLGCAALGRELTFTVRISGNDGPYAYPDPSGSEIRLASPRVTGFYESSRVYDWNNPVHGLLAQTISKQVYGDFNYDRPGGGLLWSGGVWAAERLEPLPAEIGEQLGNLPQKPWLSLESLWELGRVDEPGPALIQLTQLLRFVEQEYGASAVTGLLGAVSSAKSMSDAIERGLGIPFAEFDRKWQAWAAQNISNQ